MTSLTDAQIAYAIARFGLGVNIALHGLVRVPKLAAFAQGLQQQFAQTFLPPGLVGLTAHGIVILECIVGLLLVSGLFVRPALIAGTLLMILLISGTCLVENWSGAGLQMTYLAFYCILLATASHDAWSLDALRRGCPTRPIHPY